ncbi:hypothetical protein AKO1_006480 [Acrasis kona]|uniref:Uncharacterized protein n=1 Tax=Acrasis kona TaxID=1008807 RepID=A0AAW2YHX3_9EUKA
MLRVNKTVSVVAPKKSTLIRRISGGLGFTSHDERGVRKVTSKFKIKEVFEIKEDDPSYIQKCFWKNIDKI